MCCPANIAASMTRAGIQADEETFKRQLARAQLSAGDRDAAARMAQFNAQMGFDVQRANQQNALQMAQLQQQGAESSARSNLAYSQFNAQQQAARKTHQSQRSSLCSWTLL